MKDDDIIFEDENEDENPKILIKKLREKLKKAEEKAQEYLTGWQKERADVVNARKRDAEDKKEFTKFAAENVVADLIPVLDSFDMAFANKESWEKLPAEWTKGIEYIYSQFLSVLENHGVKRIYPLHETFNPAEHEAIEMVTVESGEDDHKIISVIQPGYSINNKLIRTAKVRVGEFKN